MQFLHDHILTIILFAPLVGMVPLFFIPGENKNATTAPSPDGMYTLPIGSITVIRGRLR